MPPDPIGRPTGRPRAVMTWTVDPQSFNAPHERETRGAIARRTARLLGVPFAGEFDPARPAGAAHAYLVPSDTLDPEAARAAGVRGPEDLLGGVVPHGFVATKAITHPLVAADAPRPPGWSDRFGEAVKDATLRGFTAFSHQDAMQAARRLLPRGPVRVKAAQGAGGAGQFVARSQSQFIHGLADLTPRDVEAHGVCIEENIERPLVLCVGQIRVGNALASYHGTQRETHDRQGAVTYGGSDLVVVRGGFEQLARLRLPPHVRRAVEQVLLYHRAVLDCYPGMFASRINYDVVQGEAADGSACSGVLEQSWRIGGATSAEITALEAFRAQPGRRCVAASCMEVHGQAQPPPQACVYFHGTDAELGPLLKYAFIQPGDDPAISR